MGMLRAALAIGLVSLAAGCVRTPGTTSDRDAAPVDGSRYDIPGADGPSSDSAIDGPVPAADQTTCTWGPFSSPTQLTALNTDSNEWSPSISADELTLFFASDRPNGKGQSDIWYVTRSTAAGSFGAPVNLTEVNTVGGETEPSISADGKELYFTKGEALFVASRPSASGSFTSAAQLVIFNGLSLELVTGAWISGDGLELYVTVVKKPEPSQELAVASRSSTSTGFTLVRLLDELNSNELDGYCTLSPDGLDLFFESKRDGIGRIYAASRADPGQPFSTPQLVPQLNGNFHAGDPDLSRDGRTIYFVANADLWVASRDCQ